MSIWELYEKIDKLNKKLCARLDDLDELNISLEMKNTELNKEVAGLRQQIVLLEAETNLPDVDEGNLC